MSFQAYIDSIKAKTGKTPTDFKLRATELGYYSQGKIVEGIKATTITDWLKSEYSLGHGHAMAIYATLKGKVD
jgi:hypothetical protein